MSTIQHSHPRQVHFPLKQPVYNELKRFENNGVIKKINPKITSGEWATPTVNINEGNNQIRIRGDFHVTLNPSVIPDLHILVDNPKYKK